MSTSFKQLLILTALLMLAGLVSAQSGLSSQLIENGHFKAGLKGWSKKGNVSVDSQNFAQLDCTEKGKFTVIQQELKNIKLNELIELKAVLKSKSKGGQIIICQGSRWGSSKVKTSAKEYYREPGKEETLVLRKKITALPVYIGIGLYNAPPQILHVKSVTVRKLSAPQTLTLRRAANPWNTTFKPKSSIIDRYVFGDPGAVDVYAAGNEYAVAAVMIYNPTPQNILAKVRIKPSNSIAEKGLTHLTIREAMHIRAQLGQLVADPLPLISRDNIISVPAKETRQLWIQMNTANLQADTYQYVLNVAGIDGKQQAAIPINYTVMNFTLPQESSRDIITWDCSLARSKGRLRKKLLKTLRTHKVNTFHVLAEMKAEFSSTGEMVTSPDFKELDDLLDILGKKNTKLMLRGGKFLRSRKSGAIIETLDEKGIAMASPEWKKALGHWVKAVSNHLSAKGYKKSQWCLYPFDEYVGKYYMLFVDTVRATDPSIRIFANPCNTKKENSDYASILKNARLRKYDVLCPTFGKYLPREDYLKVSSELKKLGIAQYFYMCPVIQKRLSPTSFYRSSGWRIFDYNLEGGGYWTSIGLGGDKRWGGNPWNDYDAKMASPVTVYQNSEEVVPSRRWEAFRAGHEDYAYIEILLKSLTRKQVYDLFEEDKPVKRNYVYIEKLRKKMANKILSLKGLPELKFPPSTTVSTLTSGSYIVERDKKEPQRLKLMLDNYLAASKLDRNLPGNIKKLVDKNVAAVTKLRDKDSDLKPVDFPDDIEKITVVYNDKINPEVITGKKFKSRGYIIKLKLYNLAIPYSQWVAVQAKVNGQPAVIETLMHHGNQKFSLNEAGMVQVPVDSPVDIDVKIPREYFETGKVQLEIFPLDHLRQGAVKTINLNN